MSCFSKALIIALLPFLDMCLDIFRAWINQKQSFDWDIILENRDFFAFYFLYFFFFFHTYDLAVHVTIQNVSHHDQILVPKYIFSMPNDTSCDVDDITCQAQF